jgi:hypothetical protein
MNFFSSPEFLTVVADVFYPGRPYEIDVAEAAGRRFRSLILKRPTEVVGQVPFLDFFEEVTESVAEPVQRAKGLVPMSTRFVSAGTWREEGLSETFLPAPQVCWNKFQDFNGFRAYVKTQSPFPFSVSKRKIRKLGREVGDVVFTFHDPSPEVLEQCMRWKSAQYQRTGLWDLFASQKNVSLFRALNERKLLTTTTLAAGDSLLGVHVGVVHDDRFYSWLPGYDPEAHKYSPGTLLFDYLLEESFKREHRVFDFLIGDEPYKWNYATDAHVIAPCGVPPLAQRIYQPVRDAIVDRLRGDNRVYKALQALKRRALEYRLRRG